MEKFITTSKKIVLVEDNPAHAELFKRNLARLSLDKNLVHFSEGESALDFIFGRGKYQSRDAGDKPHFIVLDLRLPGLSGLDILEQIKKEPEFRDIPVIMLSTSKAKIDVDKAFKLHVNSYLVKKSDFKELSNMVYDICNYWINHNVSL